MTLLHSVGMGGQITARFRWTSELAEPVQLPTVVLAAATQDLPVVGEELDPEVVGVVGDIPEVADPGVGLVGRGGGLEGGHAGCGPVEERGGEFREVRGGGRRPSQA